MLDGGLDAAYRSLLSGGGSFIRRLEVWKNGERVDTYGGSGVEIISGSLSASLESRVTRRMNLNLPSHLFPINSEGLLDPYTAELVLWCGWRGGAGKTYLWKVFTGPVVTVSVASGEGKMSLSAMDRVEQIVEDKFTTSTPSGAGRLVTTAIKDLISDSQPGAQFAEFDETYATVPPLTWEADRAKAIDDLAAGVGCFWYQLPDGRYSLRRIPWSLPSLLAPIATVTVGSELVSATLTKSRAGVYTICQVVGESTTGGPPVSGTANNNNPASPAYYLGPLGRRVLRVQQDTVSSTAQASGLARQRLRQTEAKSLQLVTRGLFDPAMELGDVLTVDTGIGTTVQAVESFSVDLKGAPIASITWRTYGSDGGTE